MTVRTSHLLNSGFAALGAAICLAFAAPAQADVLTFQTVAYGYESVNINGITPPGGGTESAGALQFARDQGGVMSTIVTFCVDVFQPVSFDPQTYALVDGVTQLGAERAGALGRLFTRFDMVNTDGVTSAQESAALQLAVWEIVTEATTVNNALSFALASGSFIASAVNPATSALAQGWLDSLDGVSSLYSVSVYTNGTFQDQMVLTKVPEPASLALMLGALGAMGATRRRKAAAA